MLPQELQSLDAYRHAFHLGLKRLLVDEGLGVTILVLANAAFDDETWAAFEPGVRERFDDLSEQYRGALRNGQRIVETDDDLMVFLKLMAIGFDAIKTSRIRACDGWELQFNPVRAFRPGRMTGQAVEGLSRPFDANGFHFNKPFLRREIFWEGDLLGKPARLLYNKFPFEYLHAILVPEPEANMPQLLTESVHHYVWDLMLALGAAIPGVRLGYNAYGALASVNHRHFQMFVREHPLTVENERWCHNGGSQAYPVEVVRFTDAHEAWKAIASLHERGITYNLVYGPDGFWCMSRKHQGSYETVPWSAGFSFYELAGSFITANAQEFTTLSALELETGLSYLRLE